MADNTTTTRSAAPAGAARPARTGGYRGPSTGGPRASGPGARSGAGGGYRGSAGGPGGARGGRSGGQRFERAKPEYDQKILAIRRVTRVVSGGRRMTFSVALAIGDRKGLVGLGTGKAIDTSMAIQKAQKDAKKNMLKLKLTKTQSLPHDISAKFGSARVMLMPNKGRGMIAGSAVRDMLLLAGVKDVTTKILSGTKNKLNNARATMKALESVGTKVMKHQPAASDRTEKVAETMADAAPAIEVTPTAE